MERGIQYVRERFFKGSDFRDLAHLRSEAARWCRDVAGLRIHGTTRRKPLLVFQDEERHALIPWDSKPYEISDWRNAKVHQDHHIQCRLAPSRSWILAACTTTARSNPVVSTTMLRLRPDTFLPAS